MGNETFYGDGLMKTWFELIGSELLVEHSHTAGGFAEAAGTELCNGNVE